MDFIKILEKLFLKLPIEHPLTFVIIVISTSCFLQQYFPWNENKNWIVFVIVILVLFFGWKNFVKIPRINAKKIGILIAILAEDESIQKRLKNDLINDIRNKIQNMGCFQLLVLNYYYTNKLISNKDKYISKYHKLTRSHLIIFGNCGKRIHEGKTYYSLKLDASAMHKKIPTHESKSFGGDMRSILPSQTLIPYDNEIVGFEITSQIIEYSSVYIIGRASFYSNEFTTAFKLHKNLLDELEKESNIGVLKNKKVNVPLFNKIKELTRKILFEEAVRLAKQSYNNNDLEKMKDYIKVVEKTDLNNYESHLLKSIFCFIKDRNTKKALEEIELAHNTKDTTWLYNKAFIIAYEGDLDKSYHIYKRAFDGQTEVHVIFQVENFILDLLEKEENKIQLWYCLGLINYLKKEDYKSAKIYFEKFIKNSEKQGKFLNNVEYAKNYLKTINEELREK